MCSVSSKPPGHAGQPSSALDLRLRSQLRRTDVVRAVRRALQSAGVADDPLVVACSGGPDSTALMVSVALLREAEGALSHVVSVDHQLRASAAQEVRDVVAVAQRLGLTGHALRVSVPSGPSRQAQARMARYAVLVAQAEQLGSGWICLGHSRDDQAETMLMRWLAGAGTRGLAGMQAVAHPSLNRPSRVRLLRPLLSISRAQIDAFLQAAAPLIAPLPIDDPSNRDPHYLRARLRHDVLPTLRRVAPHLDAHLLELADQLHHDAEYLDQQARLAVSSLLASGSVHAEAAGPDRLAISVAQLSSLPPALAARVFRLLLGTELGARHVLALRSLCVRTGGRKWLDLPGCGRVERRRDLLLFSRRAPAGATHSAVAQAGAAAALQPNSEHPVLDGWEQDA